ncbi:MAG: hypothetical protein KGL39_00550 [Patescibacteria group bacterium]|nr:hypothetical protein [Patescibacteria group bacterium]
MRSLMSAAVVGIVLMLFPHQGTAYDPISVPPINVQGWITDIRENTGEVDVYSPVDGSTTTVVVTVVAILAYNGHLCDLPYLDAGWQATGQVWVRVWWYRPDSAPIVGLMQGFDNPP